MFLSVASMIFTLAYIDGVDLGFNGETSVLDSLPSVFPIGGFSFGFCFSFWNGTFTIM